MTEHIEKKSWEIRIKSAVNNDTGDSEIRVSLRRPDGTYKYWARRDTQMSDTDLTEEMTQYLNWLKNRRMLF